jgi:excisionase family DNA binding protein
MSATTTTTTTGAAPLTYKTAEVARLLGVSEETVRIRTGQGLIPGLVFSCGHPRFRRSVIDAWLSGRRKAVPHAS